MGTETKPIHVLSWKLNRSIIHDETNCLVEYEIRRGIRGYLYFKFIENRKDLLASHSNTIALRARSVEIAKEQEMPFVESKYCSDKYPVLTAWNQLHRDLQHLVWQLMTEKEKLHYIERKMGI